MALKDPGYYVAEESRDLMVMWFMATTVQGYLRAAVGGAVG